MLFKSSTEPAQMQLTLQPERRVLTVTALSAALQSVLEADFQDIFVAGEISGCRMAASGHYYFTLKDSGSQVNCALFKGTARYVKFKPRDGLAVIARGNLQVYQPRGEYSLIVEALEPQGAGALQLAFEELKRKLTAEGLFELGRKRPLPKLPRRIGIVTSPTGAVIRDMLHVLERRFPGLHIRLFPAQVQGEGACEQIATGLSHFSQGNWAEVIIVARGGGSLEDLWAFNEEPVARAVSSSRVPVISAVGHETDFTICDFVADLRAPTPSAAAELVICTRSSLIEQIESLHAKLVQGARYRIARCGAELHQKAVNRAEALLHRAITRRAQRIDDLEFTLRKVERKHTEKLRNQLTALQRRLAATDPRLQFALHRRTEGALRERLQKTMQTRVWQARRRWEALHLHVTQLSPLTILARGYAIIIGENGQALRSSSDTHPGASIQVRLNDGSLAATVDAVAPAKK